MRRNLYFISTVIILTLVLAANVIAAQDAPQAQQATDFKGVVLKNRAPISNEILKVKFPKPVESKLKNGMDLLVLEDHRSPTIQVEVAIPGSSLNDPADLSGISSAMAAMLRLGTRTRKAQQIAETLAELGASFGAGAGEYFFYLRFSTLSENLDAVLDLFSDLVFNPTFPQDELDKWKNQQLSLLQQVRTQPPFLAQERFAAVLYPGDNRSVVAPSPESIRKITRDMIVDYYSKNIRPDGGRVAVVGDISPVQMSASLDKILGSWKGAGPKPPSLQMHPAISEKKIYLIDRPRSVQTTFEVGNHAIDRLSPDYIPVIVMNRVLGAGPASRLFRNIREEKGYTYGISSGFSASHYMNHFSASTSVRTEVTGPALDELLKEFRDIRDRLVPADELENAKRALVANFALSTESAATALRNATTIREYGLPADYWDTYPEKIAAVTAQDVQRVARKYIPVDNIQIVAVGDAAKIRDVLTKFGPIEEYDADGHRR
jgi:predicted Zn-dependent peptidase